MRPDLAYWLAFLRFPKFGPLRLARLAAGFPDMREAFLASAAALVAAGIEPHHADAFVQARETISPEGECALLKKYGLSAITRADAEYPQALLTIHDPPALLFVLGKLPPSEKPLLAVVGSRKATAYGYHALRTLVGPVASAGVGIVSGLAYGIDAAAHRLALEQGAYTLAVLGSGLDDDNLYPSQHRALASQIAAAGGAVISEYPPGTPSLPVHFPVRNRIIAGLCRATLVIEATEKSGSLITAKQALEGGRDVFAVPGPISSPLSSGPHSLIKNGALCATSAQDILEALSLAPPSAPSSLPPPPSFSNPDEAKLYQALSLSAQHIDDLVDATGLPSPFVSSTLSRLELDGHAKNLGGLHYVRV